MAHPIDPSVFHSFPQRDREAVAAFFEEHDDLDLTLTSIVQRVAGGLKVTEFVRDQHGKTKTNLRGDAITCDRVVPCTLTYEVARILHDMSERAGKRT